MTRQILFLAVAFFASIARGDEALMKQFLKEAPAAWKKFQQEHRPAHLVFTTHSPNKDTGKDEIVGLG